MKAVANSALAQAVLFQTPPPDSCASKILGVILSHCTGDNPQLLSYILKGLFTPQVAPPDPPRYPSRHLRQINSLLIKHPDLFLEDIGQPLKSHDRKADATCLTHGAASITFDKHIARASYCPALQNVNEIELTPKMIRRNPFGNWNPWEERKTIRVKVPKHTQAIREIQLPHGVFSFKVKDGGLALPFTSLWCKTCVRQTVLTNVDGVDVVLEQRGKFVDLLIF